MYLVTNRDALHYIYIIIIIIIIISVYLSLSVTLLKSLMNISALTSVFNLSLKIICP